MSLTYFGIKKLLLISPTIYTLYEYINFCINSLQEIEKFDKKYKYKCKNNKQSIFYIKVKL